MYHMFNTILLLSNFVIVISMGGGISRGHRIANLIDNISFNFPKAVILESFLDITRENTSFMENIPSEALLSSLNYKWIPIWSTNDCNNQLDIKGNIPTKLSQIGIVTIISPKGTYPRTLKYNSIDKCINILYVNSLYLFTSSGKNANNYHLFVRNS